jgi:branched-chain amino acid aminotransferase
MKVWLNGDIVDASGALNADDRGVLLGDGIFETLPIIDGAPLRWSRHFVRLRDGAQMLGMPVSDIFKNLEAAICDLAVVQGVSEGSARVTLLRGPGPRGVLPPQQITPTLIVAVHAGVVGNPDPMRVIVAQSTRRNARSPLSRIKSTNYLDAIMARQEANMAGCDDAVMLNTSDAVAEATSANIFCVIDGEIITPPPSDGALPGIMRACIMETEAVVERTLGVDDLYRADEIFLTSSLSVRPVIEIDGRAVGAKCAGPVTARLADLPRRAT